MGESGGYKLNCWKIGIETSLTADVWQTGIETIVELLMSTAGLLRLFLHGVLFETAGRQSGDKFL